MDLDSLVVFAEIVEAGGFSAAARALQQPRQRVHRRLVALEKEVGSRLLDRTTRSVRPTATGRQLLPHALRIRDHARAAHAALRTSIAQPSGTIRVTATPMVGELVLEPVTQEFLSAWPLTRLEVILSMEFEAMLERDLDLALRFGALPDSGLFARRLATVQAVICASPVYIERCGEPTRPEELGGHDVLAFATRPGETDRWMFGDDAPQMLRPRLSSTGERTVLNVCVAGLGIAQLPYVLVEPHLRDGTLVEVLHRWRPEPMPFHAVYPGRIDGNATLEAFLQAVTAQVQRLSW